MRRITADPPVAALVQAKLDALNATAAALARAGIAPDQVLAVMRPDLERVQQETRREPVLAGSSAAGPRFTFAARPRPKTYARVRKPNQVRFLSGMVEGVWVVVNLHKPGVYRHDNPHVANALRRLADAVERTAVNLADEDTELVFEPE